MRILLHYYTGTGNTEHAARTLGKELELLGAEPVLKVVTHTTTNDTDKYDYHVFLYPVYAFTLPQTMKLYLHHLPDGNGVPVAVIAGHGMISTRGGLNAGYEGPSPQIAARILKQHGYGVQITEEVGYPENLTIFANPPSVSDCAAIFLEADRKMKALAFKIVNREKSMKKYGLVERFLCGTIGGLFNFPGRWKFSQYYFVDQQCNGCGQCVRTCPAGAIQLHNRKPVWSHRCDVCLRCFNLCPGKAIQISLPRIIGGVFVFVAVFPINLWIYRRFTSKIQFDYHDYFLQIHIITFSMIFLMYYVLWKIWNGICLLLQCFSWGRSFLALTHTRYLERYLAPGFDPDKHHGDAKITNDDSPTFPEIIGRETTK